MSKKLTSDRQDSNTRERCMLAASSARKIMQLIGLSMALLMMSLTAQASDVAATLTPSSISYLSVNTTNSATATRNISIVATPAGTLQSGCLGVWIDAELNKATYAMLLTAITSQKNVNIYYDPLQPSPWGNPAWCALTVAWISP